ncbi:MAG: shikimate kinase [Alphaproteobacteria bacterium]
MPHQNIIFIGMSGAGKTFWAKRFSAEYKRRLVELDELMGHSSELADLIRNYPGKDSAAKMGNYFGMPWEKEFPQKERDYLKIERGIMAQHSGFSDSVLDLTGGAIYHPAEMSAMAKTGLVIYLETSREKQDEMFRIYLKHPKPVCWGDVFKQNDGQTREEALEQCYPALLQYRAGEYEKYADITIPYEVHKKASTAQELITYIKGHAGFEIETLQLFSNGSS